VHLTSEAILDVIEGRTKSVHPDECPECRQRLDEWRIFHLRLQVGSLQDAPPALLNAAYEVMVPRSKFREILASMIFDSFSQPAFAGARGAGTARQVVLRAAEFDVHVRIFGTPESRHITGQVLTRQERGFVDAASVHLLHDGKRIQSTTLDPLGEFEFEDAPEGLLSLEIALPDMTVVGALGNEEVA